MKINEFPALRLLVVFLIVLSSYSYWGIKGIGVFILIVISLGKKIGWKSVIIYSFFIGVCLMRLLIPVDGRLPQKCFEVKKVLKANSEQLTFIGRGNSRFIFNYKLIDSEEVDLFMGDVIEYSGDVNPLKEPKDLTGFIYYDYLRDLGVDSIVYLKERPRVVYRNKNSVYLWSGIVKQNVISYLLSFDGIGRESKAIMVALLTGDKSFLQQTEKALFRNAGVLHVLAISGLHVGIFYLTLSFVFLKLLRMPKRVGFFPVIIFLIGYSFVTGLSPSVLRATLMFGLIHFGNSFQKSPKTLNIVFGSALLMLFCSPRLIFDVGFQLSYAAVIGIVVVTRYSIFGNLKPGKFFKPIWGMVLVNISAFIFTSPIISYHFGVLNFSSVWASFFLVPLITIVMYGGVLLLLFVINNELAIIIYKLVDLMLRFSLGLLEFVVEYLKLEMELQLALIDVLIIFSILIFLTIKHYSTKIILVVSCLFFFFVPRRHELRVLKSGNEVQIKIKTKAFKLTANDVAIVDDCMFKNVDNKKVEIKTNQSHMVIDFNVNKYHCIMLEF